MEFEVDLVSWEFSHHLEAIEESLTSALNCFNSFLERRFGDRKSVV